MTGKTWYRLGNAILDLTRPSSMTVTTKVIKGNECDPALKTSELDQITFLLYPNEVNCMLKGLERPGIDLGMPFWISHVRLEGQSRRRLSREKNGIPTSKHLSSTKLLSYYIQIR
jgi:hypothetical protein